MPQSERVFEPMPAFGISSGLSVEAAPIEPSIAAAIAADHYGIVGTAEPLDGEKDANFRLTAGDGTRFFLKILNPGEEPAVSSMHSQALLHVERSAPDLPVQRIVRTPSGKADFRLAIGAETRTVRLTTFTQGQAQKMSRPSPGQARAVGQALARLQNALADFRYPAADHDTTWDMRHALRLRAVLRVMAQAQDHRLLARVLDDFETSIASRLDALPRQIVHNDFNKDNILVDETDPERVTGIIDFGDMVMTPVLFDMGIAAAYQLGDGSDPLRDTLPFLQGHASVRQLGETEIALLPVAIRTRLAMCVLIAQWRADRFPERASYTVRNNPAFLQRLRAWEAYAPGEADARIAAACAQADGASRAR